MKLLIAIMNIVGKAHLLLHFVNVNFKMPLMYLHGDCNNTVGGTDPQFKVEVYVGSILESSKYKWKIKICADEIV